MAVSEESRHRLYGRLREVIGGEDATTLMEHLPPVGWADVATKRDLDSMEERMGLRFSRVDDRFDVIDRRFGEIDRRLGELGEGMERIRSELRSSMVAFMFMVVVLVAAMVALVKL